MLSVFMLECSISFIICCLRSSKNNFLFMQLLQEETLTKPTIDAV